MKTKAGAYTIKVVAERTGVPLHTLRAWERRYGAPKPMRAEDNRYRLYDEDDIADVLWMKRQIESGLSPSQAGAVLRQQRSGQTVPGAVAHGTLTMESRRRAFEDALLALDERAANDSFDEAMALFSLEQVAAQIISPTMHRIGERWMRDEIAIAQEHFASNLLRQRLLTLLQAQPPLGSSAPLLIAACAPEEQHELGLLLFSLMARRQGWRVTYLGQRTPIEDMIEVARLSSPAAILISVTTVIGLANLIPLVEGNKRFGAPVYFGGRLFDLLPALEAHLPGTSIGADPSRALQVIGHRRAPHRLAPNKQSLAAARALRTMRMELATRTTEHLITQSPKLASAWEGSVSFATLFLVDAVACALAFDLPELMDAEGHWVRELLPPRDVPLPMLAQHTHALAVATESMLGKSAHAHIRPLLERMTDSLGANGGGR